MDERDPELLERLVTSVEFSRFEFCFLSRVCFIEYEEYAPPGRMTQDIENAVNGCVIPLAISRPTSRGSFIHGNTPDSLYPQKRS